MPQSLCGKGRRFESGGNSNECGHIRECYTLSVFSIDRFHWSRGLHDRDPPTFEAHGSRSRCLRIHWSRSMESRESDKITQFSIRILRWKINQVFHTYHSFIGNFSDSISLIENWHHHCCQCYSAKFIRLRVIHQYLSFLISKKLRLTFKLTKCMSLH